MELLKNQIAVNEEKDIISIYGIKYSGAFFRGLGFSIKEGKHFQITRRDCGIITIKCNNNIDDLIDIAKQVADGNFNQSNIIEKARKAIS